MSWITEDTLYIADRSRALIQWAAILPMSLLHDPPGQEGLSYLTAQMLTRGAGDRDHAAFHEELDLLGAQLHVGASRSGTTVSGDVLSRNLEAFEGLINDVLIRPRFEPEEFEKLKRSTLAELTQVKDHDDALGMRFFVRELFQGHPYGRPPMGTEASIASLELHQIIAWYEAHFRGPALVRAASGDMTAERALDSFQKTLGALPTAPGDRSPPVPLPPAVGGHHVTLVNKPARSQTQVFMGQPTLAASHEDYLPLLVANTLFGGTFTARLSHEIREKRGWSYGVSSSVAADRHVGTFTMRFYPGEEQTVPAIRLADSMLLSLIAAGAEEREVEAAKRFLIQSHPLGLETPEQELHQRLGLRLLGRDDAWLDRFTDEIAAIDVGQVNRALRAHLRPDQLLTTVVCTAPNLEDALALWDRPTHTQVLAYDQDPPSAPRPSPQ